MPTEPQKDLAHKTRLSDSSLYDEVCEMCGATDARNDDRLNHPCPKARKPTLLSDEQIAKLEASNSSREEQLAQLAQCKTGHDTRHFYGWLHDISALCQTVRALEGALRKANEIVEEAAREHMALQLKLAQAIRERDDYRDQLVEVKVETAERLAQVEKERDDWKEFAEECKDGIRASHRVLDELDVPREDAWLQETDGQNYGIEEVVEYPVHERIKILPPFVATRMRDACVEKVRAIHEERLRDLRTMAEAGDIEHEDAEYERAVLFVLSNVIDSLKSLTLDQVEQKEAK